MKQKIAIELIFALLLMFLCACKGNQPGGQTPAEEPSQGTEAVSNPEESNSPTGSEESGVSDMEISSPNWSEESGVNEMEIPHTG